MKKEIIHDFDHPLYDFNFDDFEGRALAVQAFANKFNFTQVWNTGRPYTIHGQRIAATVLDSTQVAFYDYDRNLSGITISGFDPEVDDLKSFTMSAYDQGLTSWGFHFVAGKESGIENPMALDRTLSALAFSQVAPNGPKSSMIPRSPEKPKMEEPKTPTEDHVVTVQYAGFVTFSRVFRTEAGANAFIIEWIKELIGKKAFDSVSKKRPFMLSSPPSSLDYCEAADTIAKAYDPCYSVALDVTNLED